MQLLVGLVYVAALVTIVVAVFGASIQLLHRRPVHRWAMVGGVAVLLVVGSAVAGGVTGNNVVAFSTAVGVAGAGVYFYRRKRAQWWGLREAADERAAVRRTEKERKASTTQDERRIREAEERKRHELREADEAQLRSQKQAEKERRASAKRAEKELREAEKEHKSGINQAEKELRHANEAQKTRIQEAERALKEAQEQGQRKLGSYKGKDKKATVELFEDRVLMPEGEARFEDGTVEATVDTAGNLAVTRRATLTRFIALGGIGALAFKKKDLTDARELYLLVEAPGLASLVQCDPNEGAEVRQFAVQINNASRAAESTRKIKEMYVSRAERELEAAMKDHVAIEAAERKLDAARSNTQRLDVARRRDI